MSWRAKDHLPQRETWNAKCSKCNEQTQVPFDPASGQTVYCRNCRLIYM